MCRGNQRRCPQRAVRNGLCDEHDAQAEREYDERRPNATARGYDARWRQTRRQFLDGHPYCESDTCKAMPQWQRPLANEVDHIDGLGPKGPQGHDPDNLRALCKPCHSRRTAADQPGGWNSSARRRQRHGLGARDSDENDDPWP